MRLENVTSDEHFGIFSFFSELDFEKSISHVKITNFPQFKSDMNNTCTSRSVGVTLMLCLTVLFFYQVDTANHILS